MRKLNLLTIQILVWLIEVYQHYLSFDRGLLMVFTPGGACKYSVTCSEYTKQQIMHYGIIKGIKKGIRRIISCR